MLTTHFNSSGGLKSTKLALPTGDHMTCRRVEQAKLAQRRPVSGGPAVCLITCDSVGISLFRCNCKSGGGGEGDVGGASLSDSLQGCAVFLAFH